MFPKWININACHFLIHLIKVTDCKVNPPIPSAPPEVPGPRSVDAPPQVEYHLNVVLSERRGLIVKEKMFKKKYKKHNKILN